MGNVGKFWNGDSEPSDREAVWGFLSETREGKKKPYRMGDGLKFEHFRECLPVGFRRG